MIFLKNYFFFFERIFRHIKEFKLKIILLFFLILLGSLLETISIGIFIPLIEVFTNYEKGSKILSFFSYFDINDLNKYEIFLYGLFVIFIFFIFKFLFFLFLNFYKNKLICNISRHIGNEVFKTYLSIPFFDLKNKNTAELINLTNNASGFANLISILISFFTDITISLFIIIFLLSIELNGTIIIVTLVSVSILIFWKYTKDKTFNLGALRIIFHQNRIQALQESYSSLMDIKIMNSHNFFEKQFDKSNYQLLNNERIEANLQSLPKLIFELVTIIFFTSLMFYFARINPIDNVFVILGIFVVAGAKILPISSRLVNYLQIIKVKIPVVVKIDDELRKYKNLTTKYNENLNEINKFEIIKFKKISFSYKDHEKEKLIFKNLDFCIFPGDKIGISGESGSGKTTFLNLLCGLLQPDIGSIQINDKEFSKNNFFKFSNILGYVSQNPILIDNTISANITLSDKNNTNNEKLQIVKNITGLDKIITNLDQKDNSFIGERGALLSGGQRQRLGIARVLYMSPEILILDEATSAIDMDNEANIFKNIINQYPKLTIIMVSHRKETLSLCKEVYDLKDYKLTNKD